MSDVNVSDIRITGEPQINPHECKFVVSVPLFPGGMARFDSAEAAQGSPLAERLFGLGWVTNLRIAENTVIVTKNTGEPWPAIGKDVGKAIRDHLASGETAVSAEIEAQKVDSDAIRAAVEDVVNAEVNPAIAAHGGFVRVIDVQGSTVYIEMGGGCQGCASSAATLKGGIERAIRERVPEVGEILDVTDHAAGTNPYYRG